MAIYELARAAELLRIAAEYIELHSDQCETIHYDGTDCDGVCLCYDLRSAASGLEAK